MPLATVAPRLAARGLVKRYGPRTVLGPLDLELDPGRLVAIMGANGAGKSTLLAAVAGLLHCSGRVEIDGAARRPGDGDCAYVPQRIRLPGAATVGEVLALFRALAGPEPDRVIPEPGFVPDAERRVGELSGGQAQRVALAGAAMGQPALLLLDEPFANLDDAGRLEAARLLRAHADGGALVLIASPAALDVLALVDQIVEIDGGMVAFDGSPDEYLVRLGGAAHQVRVGLA